VVDYRSEWRVTVSFLVSCIIFILLTTLPIFGDQSYIENPALHLEIRQTIYWGSVLLAFYLAYKTTPKDLLGSVLVSLFGPVFLMALFFTRLLYKLFPMKVEE